MRQIIVDNISTNYYITETGKCYNSKTGKYLKGQIQWNGYLTYNLSITPQDKRRIPAHRLVAIAYIPNDRKDRYYVNHIDGNKLNNNVENLEWVTPQENAVHAIETELRKFNHVYCFDKDKNLVAEYKNISDACTAVNISRSIIQQELQKEIKTLAGGFYWSYDKEVGETKNYKNLGRAKEVYQYDKNGKFIMKYPSTGIAAKAIGVNSGSHIGECCRGKLKQYKGFIWRYADDIVSTSDESQRGAGEAP